MIDWKRVNTLHDELGPDEFNALVGIFLDEAGGLIRRLRENPNPETLSDDLHFLKGCAINIGFQQLADCCCTSGTTEARRQTNTVDTDAISECLDASLAMFYGYSDSPMRTQRTTLEQ